jgi:hypothetical protein
MASSRGCGGHGCWLVSLGPQEARLLAGLPVHWSLWPAPLPPLVGGGASANAGADTARSRTVIKATAVLQRRRLRLDIESTSPCGPSQDRDEGVSTRDKSVTKTLGMLSAREGGARRGSCRAAGRPGRCWCDHERRRRLVIQWPLRPRRASIASSERAPGRPAPGARLTQAVQRALPVPSRLR